MNKEEFLKKNDELIEKFVHDKEKNKLYIEMQKSMCKEFATSSMSIELYEALTNKYGDVMMFPCLCKHFIEHRYNWFTFYIKSLKMNIDFCLEKSRKDIMFQLWRTRNILLLDSEEYASVKDVKKKIDFVIGEIESKIERNKLLKQNNKNKKNKVQKVVETKPNISGSSTKRKRIRIGEKVKY